jgi:hypothetical protein
MTRQRKDSKPRGQSGPIKGPRPETAELEAELLRLNELVRARRDQLARLEHCPHKDCECRQVWKQVVEKKLAHQFGKIRKQVRAKPAAEQKPNQQVRRTR